MEKRVTSIFVSINQSEAGEKVHYAKQIIESLDPDVRPKLITGNRFELEFENESRMWAVRAMCKDTHLAVILAPTMPTEERVYAFGTPRLIEIFENMLLSDFRQEYEVCWVDKSVAGIDWDLN